MTEEEDNRRDAKEARSDSEGNDAPSGETEAERRRREAFEERKRELEEELDDYAQAGAYSPGLVKASRWVSRILYFVMAGALAFLIISGWGKYSEEEFGRMHEAQQKWKEEAETQKERREAIEEEFGQAQLELATLRLELESLKSGRPAAERARKEARDLVVRFWGELQYGAMWQEGLERAEPGAHGDDPVSIVKSLIEQAGRAHAGQEIELLREAVDLGREATTQAVLAQLESDDRAVVRAAARLGGWLGGERVLAAARAGVQGSDEPALAFLYALLTSEPPPEGAQYFAPEAWVGYAMRRYETSPVDLAEAYKSAPDEARLALLALLAETAPAIEDALFRSVAVSNRPTSERIIAVQWLGERRPPGSEELLKKLSGGEGEVATEAERALNES